MNTPVSFFERTTIAWSAFLIVVLGLYMTKEVFPWSVWIADQALAAWAQAFGSIVAIFFAGLFALYQHKWQVGREDEKVRISDIASAKILMQMFGSAQGALATYQRQFLDKHRGNPLQHLLVSSSFSNTTHIANPTRADLAFLLRAADPELAADLSAKASDISEAIDILNRYTDFYLNEYTPEYAQQRKTHGAGMTLVKFAEVVAPHVEERARLLVNAQYSTIYRIVDSLANSRDEILKKMEKAFPGSGNEKYWPVIGRQEFGDVTVDGQKIEFLTIHHVNQGVIRWQIELNSGPEKWLWTNQTQIAAPLDSVEFTRERLRELVRVVYP